MRMQAHFRSMVQSCNQWLVGASGASQQRGPPTEGLWRASQHQLPCSAAAARREALKMLVAHSIAEKSASAVAIMCAARHGPRGAG